MKRTKKIKRVSQNLREKGERKIKIRKNLTRKKQPEDLQELTRTWDEDLCEQRVFF